MMITNINLAFILIYDTRIIGSVSESNPHFTENESQNEAFRI